jgi:hypothetical protein
VDFSPAAWSSQAIWRRTARNRATTWRALPAASFFLARAARFLWASDLERLALGVEEGAGGGGRRGRRSHPRDCRH